MKKRNVAARIFAAAMAVTVVTAGVPQTAVYADSNGSDVIITETTEAAETTEEAETTEAAETTETTEVTENLGTTDTEDNDTVDKVAAAAENDEAEEEYTYVYAGLTWAEYWANEDVYNAGNTDSSTETDARGEYDKGAFDTVSRATTNHGLHRGSYQCNAQITLTDGTTLDVAYYTGATEGVLTNGEAFSYSKDDIVSYVVTGLKYVPVKVKTDDYADFKEVYTVVENGSALAGGYSEMNLSNYTDLVANVTEQTNGLKTATKNSDGTFTFSARTSGGTESGIQNADLQTATAITVTVKDADGAYGEFLRVDLTGDDYGALGAKMQAVEWTYYGNDSTYTTALQSYGTKFAADNWMHKKNGIQLGLTDSLRCQLPNGYDGTGYWTVTVYALGYNDVTFQILATSENIVTEEEETIDTSSLEKAIAAAETLTESDYTAASWADLQTELAEAKAELASPNTQATVNEATTHLNEAVSALVKVEKADLTALNTAIKAAKALKESDYTAASWKSLQTALAAAQKMTETDTQTDVDTAASNLNAAISALVKAETTTSRPSKGTTTTVNGIKYKVTGTSTASVYGYNKKLSKKASVPANIKIDGYSFKITKIEENAFSGCTKLTKITIDKNVTTIGKKAFYKCTKLSTISGAAGVTSIGANAFEGCKTLKTINLKSTVLTTIGAGAFKNCTAITSFTAASKKLKSIGKQAFYGDKKLATITFKTTKLTSKNVGKNAFKGIKSNATFKVPKKQVSSYKKIFQAKGAGKKIKVKKL